MNRKHPLAALLLTAVLALFPLTALGGGGAPGPVISLGGWTPERLEVLITGAEAIVEPGERIGYLSAAFPGTPYRADTLIGSGTQPERLVIELGGMDCFTYLDYVEAMRLSGSYAGFIRNVARVRYRSARVAFEARNHFFTDWARFSGGRVVDATREVGREESASVLKTLNIRGDGSRWLPGVETRVARVHYIPSGSIDGGVLARLRTGDYIGTYSPVEGLDVSHTGIFVRKDGMALLRHASSAEGARGVVEVDFLEYFSSKPGIVVLRPAGL